MKKWISGLLCAVLIIACALPCAAISKSQLVGYWKGTLRMTVKSHEGYPDQKFSRKVKISLAKDGSGSFRWDDQFGSTFIGEYGISKNRFSLYTALDGNEDYEMSLYDMTMSLKGGKNLVLKGHMESMESSSSNVVMTLVRITPQIKSVKSNTVARGDESTLTVKVDTHTDFIQMEDMRGNELELSYDETKSDTFVVRHTFDAKTNKVKLRAGMKTNDGFTFWSSPKTVTVKCK